MNKATLRWEFLEKRKKLSDNKSRSLSRQITGRFIHSFDLQNVGYLHVYLPLLRQREIDTYLLIEQIRNIYPQVSILIPKADAASAGMESYLFDEDTELALNDWGIPEPVAAPVITPEQIDWIILPLLAFDEQGYRVGYGKGFYDRYLDRCRKEVRKIGLSYFGPVERIEDIDAFDVKMDYCITPDRVWEFK